MKIYSVTDREFAAYGRVITGFDFSALTKALEEHTPLPEGVVYEPAQKDLEATDAYQFLQDHVYGGLPIEIGYCNGHNTRLNCLEYHRDSEINIPSRDAVLLVALKSDIDEEDKLDTAKVKAFMVPAGCAVEVYATTLHYAPCNAHAGEGFRVAIVLPKGTNLSMPQIKPVDKEDFWMTARNKWLLAHPDSSEAANGAYIGLTGVNPDIAADI